MLALLSLDAKWWAVWHHFWTKGMTICHFNWDLNDLVPAQLSESKLKNLSSEVEYINNIILCASFMMTHVVLLIPLCLCVSFALWLDQKHTLLGQLRHDDNRELSAQKHLRHSRAASRPHHLPCRLHIHLWEGERRECLCVHKLVHGR